MAGLRPGWAGPALLHDRRTTERNSGRTDKQADAAGEPSRQQSAKPPGDAPLSTAAPPCRPDASSRRSALLGIGDVTDQRRQTGLHIEQPLPGRKIDHHTLVRFTDLGTLDQLVQPVLQVLQDFAHLSRLSG